MIDKKSYNEHHSEYCEDTKYDVENAQHEDHNKNNFEYIYKTDIPHGNVLDQTDFKVAVDIGSGTGWFANYLVEHRNYEKVYAIEPSVAATDIAKKIYPNQDKVEWKVGFSEEKLKEIELTEKTLFSTMCVLAHIEDSSVTKILNEMNSIAPRGSVFCFSEPWGRTSHSYCWHIRPESWWQEILPDWEFTFKTECVLGHEQYKGFVGVKK